MTESSRKVYNPTTLSNWVAMEVRYVLNQEAYQSVFVLGTDTKDQINVTEDVVSHKVFSTKKLDGNIHYHLIKTQENRAYRLEGDPLCSFNAMSKSAIQEISALSNIDMLHCMNPYLTTPAHIELWNNADEALIMVEDKKREYRMRILSIPEINPAIERAVALNTFHAQKESEDANEENTEMIFKSLEKRRKQLRKQITDASATHTPSEAPHALDDGDEKETEASHAFIEISKKVMPIFSDKRLNASLKKPPTGSRIIDDTFIETMEIIKEKSTLRDMVQIKPNQETAMICALDGLAREMPNFSDVVEHVKQNLLFSAHGDRYVYVAPILLAGPPGIGKTLFANKLADLLCLPYHYLAMENQVGNGSLVGTQAMYSNARAGLLYNLLVKGDIANPLILLDEIEKSGQDVRYGAPVVNQLLSLLEKNSAQQFEDQSVEGVGFDVSWVNWILTVNDLHKLPDAVISRTTLFQINPPSAEDLPHIITNIYQKLLDDRSVVDSKRLPISNCAMNALIGLICDGDKGLRDLRALLQTATVWAIHHGEAQIEQSALGIVKTLKSPKNTLKMGFL